MSFFKRNRTPPTSAKSNVIDLSETDFDDSVHRNDLVMVMFCKPDCPHCMRMEPIYQELSTEMVDRVLFCRVDILTNVGLRRKFGVTGTPTFVLIKHGSVVGSVRGECSKELLRDELVKQL
jgi:thioredoxin 1